MGAGPGHRRPSSGPRGTRAGRTESTAPPARSARRVHPARASPRAGSSCCRRWGAVAPTRVSARAALRRSSSGLVPASPQRIELWGHPDLASLLASGRSGGRPRPSGWDAGVSAARRRRKRCPERRRRAGEWHRGRSGSPRARHPPPASRLPASPPPLPQPPPAPRAPRPLLCGPGFGRRRRGGGRCPRWGGPPARQLPAWPETHLSASRAAASPPPPAAAIRLPCLSLSPGPFIWAFSIPFFFLLIPSFLIGPLWLSSLWTAGVLRLWKNLKQTVLR